MVDSFLVVQPHQKDGPLCVVQFERITEITEILAASAHERPPPPTPKGDSANQLAAKLRAKQTELRKAEVQAQKFAQYSVDVERLIVAAKANQEASLVLQAQLRTEAAAIVVELSKLHSGKLLVVVVVPDEEFMDEDGHIAWKVASANDAVDIQVKALQGGGAWRCRTSSVKLSSTRSSRSQNRGIEPLFPATIQIRATSDKLIRKQYCSKVKHLPKKAKALGTNAPTS